MLLRATLVHVMLCVALFVVWAIVNALIAFGSITGEVTVEVSPSAGPAMHSLLSMVVLIFLYCVVTSSYEAACLRWMIRGETAGFAGFSLGGDTWRVYSGYWIWFLIGMASYVPTMLIVTLVARALSAASLEEPILAVVSVYGGLALWSLLIIPLALRFAPGNATSVAHRKFSYFAGWRVSQGRFWALFGSFITLWIIWLFALVALMVGLSLTVFGFLDGVSDRGLGLMPAGLLLYVLPISSEILETDEEERAADTLRGDFIFEPEPEEIMQRLLPVYVETQIYRALLESTASEQGARMTAMRNASKNAGELIDTLTLQMNRARQAEITQEILEVVAGAEALT